MCSVNALWSAVSWVGNSADVGWDLPRVWRSAECRLVQYSLERNSWALFHVVSQPLAPEPVLVHTEVTGFLERSGIQSLLRPRHGIVLLSPRSIWPSQSQTQPRIRVGGDYRVPGQMVWVQRGQKLGPRMQLTYHRLHEFPYDSQLW